MLALIAGRVLAANGTAVFFNALAQFKVGGGVGRVDGCAQKRHGGCTGFDRRTVALAVQPVSQAADNDCALFSQFPREIKRGLPPVGAGAAGAHHTHIAPPVQAGGIAGDVEHQRHVGQVAQPVRVGGIVGGDDLDAGQQAVVEPLLVIERGRVAQLGGGVVA